MNLHDLLRILRRRRRTLILCIVLVPAAAVGLSLLQTKQYRASASLLFRDPAFDQKLFGSTVLATSTDPQRAAATNQRLVSLEVVADRAAHSLHTGISGEALRRKITIRGEGQSDLVSIDVSDPDPQYAARIANTFAQEYIAFRRDADRSKIAEAERLVQREVDRIPDRNGARARSLRANASQLEVLASLQTGNAELVQMARPPENAYSPHVPQNGALGLIFGLVLGVGLVILLDRLDRRPHSPTEVQDLFGRPLLGVIPESKNLAASPAVSLSVRSPEAEAFRMLRANLRYFNVDDEIHSVVVTSAAPGDGKSTVSWNLAAAAAGAGMSVLLIEADMRRPSLAPLLGVPMVSGLSTVLAGDATLDDVVASYESELTLGGTSKPHRVDYILSGPTPPNPIDLLESVRMRDLVAEAESRYDLVVIDTPPTSMVSDAIPVMSLVKGLIVVTRIDRSTREDLTRLREQLENLKAPTLGVVVNRLMRQGDHGYYGYGYSYGPVGHEAEQDVAEDNRRDQVRS